MNSKPGQLDNAKSISLVRLGLRLIIVLTGICLLALLVLWGLYETVDDEQGISDQVLENFYETNQSIFIEAFSTATQIKRQSLNDAKTSRDLASNNLYKEFWPLSHHRYITGVEFYVNEGVWLQTPARQRDRSGGVTRLLDKYYWHGFNDALPEDSIVTNKSLEDAWAAHKENNTELSRDVILMKPMSDGWYLLLKASVYDY